MQTEAAIRLLAELEQPDCPDIDLFAVLKFNYVVACQIYGPLKKKLDPKAEDIEFLLARHPNLRVAYVDTEVLLSGKHFMCISVFGCFSDLSAMPSYCFPIVASFCMFFFVFFCKQ